MGSSSKESDPCQDLAERLAEEMTERWRRGERPHCEEFFRRHPGLTDYPEAAAELIYEEICLRREFGEPADVELFLNRFPQWRRELQVMLACHELLEASDRVPQFPRAGEALDDFQLLAELGRGAQGRVFLARQPRLADRPVVLKLVPRSSREHLSLARLQHTHIVPLYFTSDEPARHLLALCMPYFGSATLARVLERLRGIAPQRRTGQHLLQALREVQATAPIALPVEGPACRLLARASYPQAVCWIGACLADALQYAHERGLVHLDLKPSNVLLAADGQPMLLDFHLARAPLPAGAAVPDWLGGTPAYLAPEQQRALDAVGSSEGIPTAVDGRADLYALGLLLYEALGGPFPPPDRAALRALRRANPQVPPSLADLLGKCLSHDPGQRYACAADVAADLRRYLTDQPLRGIANRSLVERWRKWRRRRPNALAVGMLLLLVLAATAVATAHVGRRLSQAEAALDEGRDLLRQGHADEARQVFRRGLALAEDLPFGRRVERELGEQLRLVERTEAGRELHAFVEQVRACDRVDATSAGDLREVEARCRELWERRDLIRTRLGPGTTLDPGVRRDLLDLAIHWTHLRLRLVAPSEATAVRRDALRVLTEVEEMAGPSSELERERQLQAAALGHSLLPAASPRRSTGSSATAALAGTRSVSGSNGDATIAKAPVQYGPR